MNLDRSYLKFIKVCCVHLIIILFMTVVGHWDLLKADFESQLVLK